MEFHFSHEIILPSIPIDVAFERLTSVSHVEQVVRLSKLVSDFELLSEEDDVLHYRFAENISFLHGLINKRLLIVVKQTRDTNKKSLLYESNVNQGMVNIIKLRSFTPTKDGGTLVTETVDGKCSALYQPMTKREGHRALIEHMSRYHTLFNDIQT